ncbi:MAG TPA: hypothetical protein VNR39_10675 [Pseudolabrys sp.]|nr:hypothetical protein [Pseudolabrys sp.]
MTRLPAALLTGALLALGTGSAVANDGCAQSRDYILGGMAGPLIKPVHLYKDLFKTCLQSLELPNVKNAYVLKAGLIAIEPRHNSLAATASTLTQFCRRFPRGTARVITPGEQRQARTIGLTVLLPALSTTSCLAKRGGS